MPSEIVLLRHGESDWNELRIVQGQQDAPTLLASGREQAREVATRLAGSFDIVVSSDLQRCVQTAEIVRTDARVPLEFDERLRERCFGDLEGGPLTALTPEVTGIAEGMVMDVERRAPGGESLDELAARAAEALGALRAMASDARVLVVTHGGTIRALRACASGIAMLGLEWDAVGNCSVWSIDPVARLGA